MLPCVNSWPCFSAGQLSWGSRGLAFQRATRPVVSPVCLSPKWLDPPPLPSLSVGAGRYSACAELGRCLAATPPIVAALLFPPPAFPPVPRDLPLMSTAASVPDCCYADRVVCCATPVAVREVALPPSMLPVMLMWWLQRTLLFNVAPSPLTQSGGTKPGGTPHPCGI